jgi:hypothetical protein
MNNGASNRIAIQAILICQSISEEILREGQRIEEAWNIYEDILESAIEQGYAEALRMTTSSITELIDTVVEERSQFEDPNIARHLMSDFLNGWAYTIEMYGGDISSGDDVTETSFRFYRFFEQNFGISIKVMLSEAGDSPPAGWMFRLATSVLGDMVEVAVVAAQIENTYLCSRLTKAFVEVGLGFGDNMIIRRQIIGGLNMIKSENKCGEEGVQRALSELQQHPREYMRETGIPHDSPWVFNLISYTFDEREGFVEAVSELQDEVFDQPN